MCIHCINATEKMINIDVNIIDNLWVCIVFIGNCRRFFCENILLWIHAIKASPWVASKVD